MARQSAYGNRRKIIKREAVRFRLLPFLYMPFWACLRREDTRAIFRKTDGNSCGGRVFALQCFPEHTTALPQRKDAVFMSIQKVRAYFDGLGIAGRIQEFTVSSATVELAAQAVGVEEARIAKTLSFKTPDGPILIVAAGDAKVDNGKYKAQFHTKAKMLTHDEAHTLIGHDVGGVCPFALPEDVGVYLDASLKRFRTVFPAAGSANSAVEMTCAELERYASNFRQWVDVCKGWNPPEE